MKLELLPGTFSVARLNPNEQIPDWFKHEEFSTVSRTNDELSLVCKEHLVPQHVKQESGWRIMKVQGTLDFGQTGVLSSILTPLAKARISIFSISTFDTDYILVKANLLQAAMRALKENSISCEESMKNL